MKKRDKNDLYDILANFPECSQEETDEVIAKLRSLSEDDLTIVQSEKIKVKIVKKG